MKDIPRHDSIRGEFAYQLYRQMEKNEKIIVITCDLGYGMFDYIRSDFPDRFLNVGAAEQAGMGIAVGYALTGYIVFIYSITTFLIYRPFETIKLYLQEEHIPVRLIGSGRDNDYKHDGPSHNATGIDKLFQWNLDQITTYRPDSKEEIEYMTGLMVNRNVPQFISLRR